MGMEGRYSPEDLEDWSESGWRCHGFGAGRARSKRVFGVTTESTGGFSFESSRCATSRRDRQMVRNQHRHRGPKRTEEKLRQDEREIRRITDAIPQTIVVLEPDGSPIYANQAVLDYTGLAAGRRDHLGLSCANLSSGRYRAAARRAQTRPLHAVSRLKSNNGR